MESRTRLWDLQTITVSTFLSCTPIWSGDGKRPFQHAAALFSSGERDDQPLTEDFSAPPGPVREWRPR